jgi:hypothetical protein
LEEEERKRLVEQVEEAQRRWVEIMEEAERQRKEKERVQAVKEEEDDDNEEAVAGTIRPITQRVFLQSCQINNRRPSAVLFSSKRDVLQTHSRLTY